MGSKHKGRLLGYLPLAVIATSAVVVAPMLLVFWLRTADVVASVWTGAVLGVLLSLAISQAGAAAWKRTDSEILFSELMLWGWVQRVRSERRLAKASDRLGLSTGRPKAIVGGTLTNTQKSSLLTQLTSSLEARDQYTHGHSRRVARYAANVAKQMGLSRTEVAKIRAAGAMHDVGKVETPLAVLHKESKLTDEEYEIVKRHPSDGADMVATLDDDELTAIVRHHHERLDGTGYPAGLAGDEIPLGARILAVADTFDAITSTRPYRHANAHKKALDILSAEAGTQLDPDAVRAFRSCYSGRRPLTAWTILVNARPRAASLLGDSITPAAASNVLATAATAAAVGAVAVPVAMASPDSSRPAAPVAALASSSTVAGPLGPLSPRVAAMAAFAPERPAGSADRSRAGESSGPSRSADGTGGHSTAGSPKPGAGSDRSAAGGTDSRSLKTQSQDAGGGGSAGAPARAKQPVKVPTAGPPNSQGQGNAYGYGKSKGHGNANGHAKGNNGQGIVNRPPTVPRPAIPVGQGRGNGLGNVKPKQIVDTVVKPRAQQKK